MISTGFRRLARSRQSWRPAKQMAAIHGLSRQTLVEAVPEMQLQSSSAERSSNAKRWSNSEKTWAFKLAAIRMAPEQSRVLYLNVANLVPGPAHDPITHNYRESAKKSSRGKRSQQAFCHLAHSRQCRRPAMKAPAIPAFKWMHSCGGGPGDVATKAVALRSSNANWFENM